MPNEFVFSWDPPPDGWEHNLLPRKAQELLKEAAKICKGDTPKERKERIDYAIARVIKLYPKYLRC